MIANRNLLRGVPNDRNFDSLQQDLERRVVELAQTQADKDNFANE
jgi:hypothetical protein